MTADRFHEYGSHSEETAPVYVDLRNGKPIRAVPAADLLARPADFTRLAPGLLRQRRALNGLAYERSRACLTDAAVTTRPT